MKRISVSGAPGSGKTTLINELLRLVSGATMTPDLPRVALTQLDGTHFKEVDAFQHYVGIAQLLAEKDVPQGDYCLHDKSLIDALAYWRVLVGGADPSWSAALAVQRYFKVFVCDFRDVLLANDDPIRAQHLHIREDIHHAAMGVMKEYNIESILLSGDVPTRVSCALKLLQQ